MAKYLKDILKQAHDTIKGVRSSETSAASVGKDPGVDYKPKSGDEADFIAKHSVQKWDDPAGNPNFADKVSYTLNSPKEKNHGNTEAKAKATNEEVSESKKAEDVQCNSTSEGTECPVHGIAECMSARPLKELTKKTLGNYVQGATRDALSKQYSLGKGEKVDTRKLMNRRKGIDKAVDKMANEEAEQIDELSTDLLHRAAHKAAKVAMTDVQGRSGPIFKKRAAQANKFRAKGMEQEKREKAAKAVKEETIDEVLTKSTSAGETIHDFVHSDNPKFKGKSKEKRKEMALAAYYQKQNEEVEIDEGGPVAPVPAHLDSHGIAKKYKDYVTGGGTPETASRYKSHVNAHAKKTGQQPDAVNKEVRKHVKNMKEAYAVEPLLGGDSDHDEGAEMVKAELKAIANKAMHLVMQMPDSMHVEPWCQAKIANAKSYVNDVHDYMVYGNHKDEEDEQSDTPLTLPNMSVDVNTGQNV